METSVKVPVKTKARPGSARTYRAQPRWPFLWILPAFLIYFVFKLAPMIAGFYLALLKWDGINPAKFIGLQNFTQMIGDPVIGQALLHNALYAAGTVVGKIVVSLFLALLLNQALRARAAYRTLLFLPVVMSFVVVGILWSWLFNTQFGLVNNLLQALHLDFLIADWLGDPKVALWSLMLVDIWKWYGFHMVIFLAGLQLISAELYESARIDGASRVRQLLSITLPLLQPVMLVNVTLSLMGAFNVFDIPYVMTEGGPANSTTVMALDLYREGFQFYKFGYSAAMSYVLLVIVTVVAAVQMKLMTRTRID